MYSARATADSIIQYTFNNVGADSSIKVVYKIRNYSVISSAGNGGSIAPQGVSTVNYGDRPTYTITPNVGYVIDSVFVNNTPVNSINNNYIFDSVKSNKTIQVAFKLLTYTINAIAGNGGSIAPQGTSTVNYGDRPTYTITPSTGYVIDSITINGNKIANENNITLDSVKSNQTIRVAFKLLTYTINAIAGNGGSIAPQAISSVNYGDRPSYTITPNTGYIIDSILVNDTFVNNVNISYTFDSVKSNQTIRVAFKLQNFTITAIAGNGGSISPQWISSVNYGTTPSYTITPNTGYIIDSIIVNGNKVLNVNNYTFDSVKSNQTIRVLFKLQTYTITAIAGNGGGISPQGTSAANYGTTPNYTITPNTGYLIDSVFVNNTLVNIVNTNYTFDTIKSNQTIRVVFKLQTFSITSSAGTGGSISYMGDSIVNYGSNLSYIIAPNTGFTIDSLIVDGVVQLNNNIYTFSNITDNHRVRVTFKLIQFIITGFVNASQGRISTIQDTVNYGSNLRVTYQANSGFNLAYILVDNNIIQYDSLVGYTFYNITKNHSITPFFTYITIPNPPTNIIAVGGNGQATITFTAPVNNGGTAINKYNISTTTGNITASGVGSPIIVTGLTNGTSYRFVVNAINAIGSSLSSDTSNAITTILNGKYINTIVVGGQISQTAYIDSGTNFVVNYTSKLGYVLDSIYINGGYNVAATVDSLNQYTFNNVGVDAAIKVVYKIRTYSITTSAGNGGGISSQGVSIVNYGDRPRYIITPNIGYVIDSFFVNNTLVNNVINNYTFDSVKENQTIRVVFKIRTYTINAIAGNGGSITPQGVSTVNYGDRPSYIIAPNMGYVIDSITINGNKISNVHNITLDSVKENQTIRVVFKLLTYTIHAIAGNGGSITPQGNSTVYYGDRPSYTITPNTGYLIDSITINGNKMSIVNNIILDSVKANQSISVVFKIKTYTIASSAGIGGSITFVGDSIVNYGSNLTYNFAPNAGYLIDSLIVDEVVQSNNNMYSFNNITANHHIRVTFKPTRFIITGFVNASQGRISTIRDTVNYGATIRVTYQANNGYNLAYIIVDNIINYDSVLGYTFTNITQNHNVLAIFANNITIPNS
ncbi:MAG: fibronectin type III domain-containing protein, partial [Sediminibacterium sp.]|nr:fibronectin type III domain-containing protein [Sediminibacterium sp.]